MGLLYPLIHCVFPTVVLFNLLFRNNVPVKVSIALDGGYELLCCDLSRGA